MGIALKLILSNPNLIRQRKRSSLSHLHESPEALVLSFFFHGSVLYTCTTYIFSLPFCTKGDDQLFPGSCQEDRFGKILEHVVEELPDMFLN